MIQIIGVMVAAYIAFRCIDAMTRSRTQFASEIARNLTLAFAGITLMIAVVGGLVLLFSDVDRTSLRGRAYSTIELNLRDARPAQAPVDVPIDPAEAERMRAANRKLMEEYERSKR